MLGKKSTVKHARLNRAASFVIENLESRCLLSASIVAKPTGDSLLVRGTDRADSITVGLNADTSKIDVSINGVVQQFDKATLTSIVINGGGGADAITIDEANGLLPFGVLVNGGGGSDNIKGSSLGDTLNGGGGLDNIIGNGGNDVIYGNAGNDYLWGNDGGDTIYGADGRDAIFAGAGDDVAFGNGGADTIDTGTGNDYSDGGGGQNHVDDDYSKGISPPRHFFDNSLSLTPAAVNNTPEGLAPGDVRRAYNFGSLADPTFTNRGAGQAIAIVDAYHSPTAFNDLTRFSVEYGLTTPTDDNFRVVYANGVQPATDPSSTDYNGWATETMLDIQWAHAIAPDATIILVEAQSNLFADLVQAVDVASNTLISQFRGGVVSMSFGSSSESKAFEPIFTNPRYRNVTYVASSGDTYQELSYPSSSPNVLAVGGTFLLFDENGNAAPGLGWNEGDSGSGGGISGLYATPAYQTGVQIHGTTINEYGGGFRIAPDVAYNSSPLSGYSVFQSFSNTLDGDTGWITVGGTSAAAPQWAAIIAMANQKRVDSGKQLLGRDAIRNIYSLASTNYPSYFTDVIDEEGGKDPLTDIGFDEVTGWGTPRATNLINALGAMDAVSAGVRETTFSGTYLEAISKYPGGVLTNLFQQYDGTGTVTVGLSAVNLTFTVVDKFGLGSSGAFTLSNIPRSGNTFQGVASETFTIDGPKTSTAHQYFVKGYIRRNGDGSFHVDGYWTSLNLVTGEPVVRGLEENFYGTFST